jgi:dTMP kinase
VARRIPAEETARINAFAVGDCLPDITFLLDLDHKTSLSRMQAANRKPDRIERESPEFFEAVRQGYLKVAKENPRRVVLIDASCSVEEIAVEVLAKIISEINK